MIEHDLTSDGYWGSKRGDEENGSNRRSLRCPVGRRTRSSHLDAQQALSVCSSASEQKKVRTNRIDASIRSRWIH